MAKLSEVVTPQLLFDDTAEGSISTPGTDEYALFVDGGVAKLKDDGGNVSELGAGGLTKLFDNTVGAGGATSIDTDGTDLSGYDVLEIYTLLRSDESAQTSSALLRFNNDSGGNYHRSLISNANTTLIGFTGAGETSVFSACRGASATAGYFGLTRVTIPFYAETVAFKTMTAFNPNLGGSAAEGRINVAGFTWASSAAITRVAVSIAGGFEFIQGSRLLIYGR